MYSKNKIYLAIAVIIIMLLIVVTLWIIGRAEETPTKEAGTTQGVNTPADTAEKFAERGDISQGAEEIKQELVSPLRGSAGTLFENEEMRIDYIPPIDPFPDRFSIEIFIENSAKAKQGAVEWFNKQGFSSKDICELPILFFLSNDVAETYIQQNIEFDPLLENC